ncbi:hypothetical protein DH09_04785 [Bacillaceae bacterium JMAK1]|nr:hypothetical protein DH09_04785 [Bacillaceae bacterium JMAK1]
MKKAFIGATFTLLIVVIAAFSWYVFFGDEADSVEGSEGPTIDEIVSNSWDTEQLTTNLSSDHIIRASFRIEGDREETRIEIEKRDFQIKNAIIHRLAGMEADQLQDSEGLRELEQTLKEDITNMLEGGSVINVYTTERVIQ